ncbi:norrin-like [Physella acuta]|uniref:norrin-like n=1 Tax=Physella acuta TaxID=109671 RepID=UPI0027DBBF04|nr:norrin-like [Physella acuta]
MFGTDIYLLLTLWATLTSAMLYNRYKPNWYTSSSRPATSSSSSSLLRMRHELDNLKSRSMYGTRSDEITRETCSRHSIAILLRPPLRVDDDCWTTFVKSYACKGGCTSYSQVDPRNSSNIFHSCNCCQPLSYSISIALIPCKNGQRMRVPVKDVLDCSCRPCYTDAPPKDIVKLRDLLTKAAVDTPLPRG